MYHRVLYCFLLFFLLFLNDLLHTTLNPVHSYAVDYTLDKSSSFPSQPSSVARSQYQIALSSAVNAELGSISSWGCQNLVKFNASKTQLIPISLSITPSNYDIIFDNNVIQPLNSINMLGIVITSNLSWRQHISEVAKSASNKLRVLFRCRKYFFSEQLL